MVTPANTAAAIEILAGLEIIFVPTTVQCLRSVFGIACTCLSVNEIFKISPGFVIAMVFNARIITRKKSPIPVIVYQHRILLAQPVLKFEPAFGYQAQRAAQVNGYLVGNVLCVSLPAARYRQ